MGSEFEPHSVVQYSVARAKINLQMMKFQDIQVMLTVTDNKILIKKMHRKIEGAG